MLYCSTQMSRSYRKWVPFLLRATVLSTVRLGTLQIAGWLHRLYSIYPAYYGTSQADGFAERAGDGEK